MRTAAGAARALLVGTALLYLIGLSESGWANQYYSAAAEAGSKSWTAFLFGSLDSSNFITVDKPPASLWVMDLSVRIFGLSSWSILVPQALEGVAAVALLYAAVKRVSSPSAGLLAGAILATTPVATLMFRFNNPDALLVLLMTAAAYATVRAVEAAKAKWLALAGVLLGFAFLTKMLQGFLIVPALAIAYLVAAPTTLRKRILHTLGAGARDAGRRRLVGRAGRAVAGRIASLHRRVDQQQRARADLRLQRHRPADRIEQQRQRRSAAPADSRPAQTGWTRLFGSEMGTQISWLLPAALVGIAALAWLCGRAPRTDRLRASLIVWGGWVICTGIVLSFASGIIHPYYTVALAPGIAATVALAVVDAVARSKRRGGRAGCSRRSSPPVRWWTFELLGRAADWAPWLRWAVVLLGAAAVVVGAAAAHGRRDRRAADRGDAAARPDRVLAADRVDRAHRRAADGRAVEHVRVRRTGRRPGRRLGGGRPTGAGPAGFGGTRPQGTGTGPARRGAHRPARAARPIGGGMPGGLGGASTRQQRADDRADQERQPLQMGRGDGQREQRGVARARDRSRR